MKLMMMALLCLVLVACSDNAAIEQCMAKGYTFDTCHYTLMRQCLAVGIAAKHRIVGKNPYFSMELVSGYRMFLIILFLDRQSLSKEQQNRI